MRRAREERWITTGRAHGAVLEIESDRLRPALGALMLVVAVVLTLPALTFRYLSGH